MYLINIPQFSYSDPWLSSFEERIRSLVNGDRRIAYFYENPDNSTFRYRVYNMIQVLCSRDAGISAAYFTRNEIDQLDKVVDIADVLVICRSKYDDKLDRVITRARNKGKRVLFDVDDLIFNPAYIHLVLNTLDQDLNHPNVWDFWFAYLGRLGMTLSLCDGAITTNEYLVSRIQEFVKKPVSIIPNFLNREQIEFSEQIYKQKLLTGFERDGRIHLGYFSGTPTHNKDLEMISDALVSLLEKYPHLIFRLVGFMDLKGPLRNFQSRIECFPLQDFINLQRLIGEVEINLVPLQDNQFTNCKSELKYFEAGIVGTTTIASPTYTYTKAIRNGDNGYLANAYEWYGKIEGVINNLDGCPAMAERAYQDSERKYAWYNLFEHIEGIFFEAGNR